MKYFTLMTKALHEKIIISLFQEAGQPNHQTGQPELPSYKNSRPA
jgi:hypothetical protein